MRPDRTSTAAAIEAFPTIACSAAPAAMQVGGTRESAQVQSEVVSKLVATLTRNEPRAIPGQTPVPRSSTAASARPDAGHTAVA
jgi:hypothetical protein